MTPDQLRAELQRLALTADADRCADALAALVEPLMPTSDQLVAWLEGRGWTVEIGDLAMVQSVHELVRRVAAVERQA